VWTGRVPVNEFLCRLFDSENIVLLFIYVFVLPVMLPVILYILIRDYA
jgi:hypothetical protein